MYKRQDLNYRATKSQGLGLANLTIEAGLQLNPKIKADASLQKYPIYKVNDNRFVIPYEKDGKTKMVIYEDSYKGNRVVYKQEETEYINLKKGGFRPSELSDSWTSNDLAGMKNDLITIDSDIKQLQDKLVRPNAGDKTPVIKAKYTDSTKTKIKIELSRNDQEGWFKNVFNSYNFALNLFAQFEYATKKNPNQWVAFKNQDTKNNPYVVDTPNAVNGWTFDVQEKDVIKVRYRLIESPTKGQHNPDSNNFVQWINFDKDDPRLIANETIIQDKYIQFQSSWVKTQELTSAKNVTLEQINTNDVTSYEDKIIDKIATGNGNNPDLDKNKLKQILEFKYFINDTNVAGMNNLSAGELVNKLKELLGNRQASDDGAFSGFPKGEVRIPDGRRRVRFCWRKNGGKDLPQDTPGENWKAGRERNRGQKPWHLAGRSQALM